MELREFTNNLARENGLRSYMHFETFVYKLLEMHLQEQSKQILSYENRKISDGSIDFLLPEGINEISGPVGVVVKFVKRNVNSYFATVRRQCENLKEISSIKSLLFILAADISDDKKIELKNIGAKISGIEVYIWDMSDLSKIADKYTECLPSIVYNLDKEFVNNVVSKSLKGKPNQWREKRK